MRYIAPEITRLEPSHYQARLVADAMDAIETTGRELWEKGRGAGKSTTRAMIAQAILDAEEFPLYEVRPIVRRNQ